jgi:hypothetical protein
VGALPGFGLGFGRAWFALLSGGTPPVGYFGWKSNGYSKIAKTCSAKILQSWDLRLKYCQ